MRAFVIAMDCEAECVRPYLGLNDRLYVSGIGKVNAAASTQKAICEGSDEIWNIGLCGGFGSNVSAGGIFTIDRAVEYDFDLAMLNGTAVGVLNEYDTPYLPFEPVAGLPVRTLATGDRFTDSETDYALITKELGASLRDMEGAAIAHVCKKAGVRCRAVKCVTNVAGCGLMTRQYEENKVRALARLSQALGAFL